MDAHIPETKCTKTRYHRNILIKGWCLEWIELLNVVSYWAWIAIAIFTRTGSLKPFLFTYVTIPLNCFND